MNHKPKVLIYGDFDYYGLSASFERAFKKLSFNVDTINIRKADDKLSFWLTNRIFNRLTIKNYSLRKLGSSKWNKLFCETADRENYNLIFILKGEYLFPETLEKVKNNSDVKVFIFNPDSPLPGNPNKRPEHLPLLNISDHYFIWSKKIQRELKKIGNTQSVSYLPFAWDSKVYPNVGKQEQTNDVIFIGGWDQYREDWLAPVADNFDLKIWGPSYWKTRTASNSPLKKCWMGEDVRGSKASEIISQSKISLNILREQNLPDGTNMRTFEVPGCGGFVLSNYSTGAVEIYKPGISGAYFTSVDKMLTKIDYYLKHQKERNKISSKATEITRSKHKYTNRVKKILDLL